MKQENKTDDTKFMPSKVEKIFGLVKDEKGKIHIVLGGYAVSQKTFDTFKQADQYISSKPYEILINICAIILTKNHNETNNETTKDA